MLAPFASQLSPAVNCYDLRLRDHGYSIKSEAVQGLLGRQMRFGEMPFDPSIGTLCQLMLGNSR
jgi:hypothetical protein